MCLEPATSNIVGPLHRLGVVTFLSVMIFSITREAFIKLKRSQKAFGLLISTEECGRGRRGPPRVTNNSLGLPCISKCDPSFYRLGSVFQVNL
uniref:Uncharacterized protein n=1 Tax=Pyxicephalus adspersus TaxID=30357 RepID=A0AAV3A186_PYXAD|nr:TPA: hypothetical protein GDO54_017552 [Pyxicephalus adspersus]